MGKREENKKQKQEAILEAALKVFSEKGYAVAKIAEVAQAGGVGKGTIYEYYNSKENLFFGVFQWYVDEIVSSGMVDASQLGGDEAARLRAFMKSAVVSGIRSIEYFSITLEFWAAAGNPTTRDRFRGAMQNFYNSFKSVMVGLIESGKHSGVFHNDVDPIAMAAGLTGALDGLMLQYWMDSDFDLENIAANYMNTVLNGMLIRG